MELFTNASNKGFGCYFQGQWCQGTFPWQAFKDQEMSINWHKLYAVTMALALWGPQLKVKCLLFHWDNASVVHIMAKASTHSKTMMALVHTFTFLSMQHNVHFHIQHIARVNNDIADAYPTSRWIGSGSSVHMQRQIPFPWLIFGSAARVQASSHGRATLCLLVCLRICFTHLQWSPLCSMGHCHLPWEAVATPLASSMVLSLS